MNIPAELRSIPQWIVWRYEQREGQAKPTKVPYQVNGLPATITNREHCATFEDALSIAGQFSGLGFCFFADDGITGVDLDNPFEENIDGKTIVVAADDADANVTLENHRRIVAHLNSYTELSPSRKGVHTFVFGKLPVDWRKRVGKVEIYGQDRFFTVTGERLDGTSVNVEHAQYRLEEVAKSLGFDKINGSYSDFVSQPATRTDVEVYNAIINSSVGAAFLKLYNGDTSDYPSGSEADLGLANYICFATNNKEQAHRIFCTSQHYANRQKLKDRPELLWLAISKGFDKKPPPIDLSGLSVTATAVQEMQAAPVIAPDTTDEALMRFPDGALGFIAHYIYSSAPYPIAEYALGGAIGLLSAICGRAWNIEGAGLNCYVAIVGRSGSGKDAVQSGITRLLGEFDNQIPAARKFLGARSIASAQALSKMFDPTRDNSPSQVSIIPEFGEFLSTHTDPRADGTKRALIADFLAIYGVSGNGQEFGSMVYSDRDKNVAALKSPSFSMIGDTVAESFYEACTEAQMIKGLVPRMSIFERKAPRPQRNENAHLWRPDSDWVTRFGYVITRALELNQKNAATPVGYSIEAKAIFDAFDAECDAGYRNNSDAIGNIYSRAPLKAKKMAALCAVGMQWLQPIITPEQAHWACQLARRDISNFTSRIAAGEIETKASDTHGGYSAEQRYFANIYLNHTAKPFDKLGPNHKPIGELAHRNGYINAAHYRNLVTKCTSLKNDGNKNRRANEIIKNDFKGVLRMATGAELKVGDNVALVDQMGLKAELEYVVAIDIEELKRMAPREGV